MDARDLIENDEEFDYDVDHMFDYDNLEIDEYLRAYMSKEFPDATVQIWTTRSMNPDYDNQGGSLRMSWQSTQGGTFNARIYAREQDGTPVYVVKTWQDNLQGHAVYDNMHGPFFATVDQTVEWIRKRLDLHQSHGRQ